MGLYQCNIECGPGRDCIGGICVPTLGCVVDANCAPGRVCSVGACVTPTPTSCSVTADCPAGLFCADGICARPTPTIFITRTPRTRPHGDADRTATRDADRNADPDQNPRHLGPAIAIDDVLAREGTSPFTTFFEFTVTLSRRLHQTVTVNFATTDGTATAGSDYVARSGTLTFSPGVTVLPSRSRSSPTRCSSTTRRSS